jgi:hypothetical protein
MQAVTHNYEKFTTHHTRTFKVLEIILAPPNRLRPWNSKNMYTINATPKYRATFDAARPAA